MDWHNHIDREGDLGPDVREMGRHRPDELHHIGQQGHANNWQTYAELFLHLPQKLLADNFVPVLFWRK